jgi:sulfate adenylyltransferase (ADP) / ATP adenylyltransferase
LRLAEAIAERTAHALATGALEPIETEETALEDGGIRFLVRRVSTLAQKERVRQARAAVLAPLDPFDPPDRELTVASGWETHVAVLNKFPVLSGHLLLVTRRFADQEELLDADDMAVIAHGLAEIDGLAFYNAGAMAGASQPHKHLQLVPLPLGASGPRIPIEPIVAAVAVRDGPARLAPLRFAHAFARIAPDAPRLLDAYYALLAGAGLTVRDGRASAPYNLLATRDWMLVVPRARERFEGMSINALGFAGSLFVRDDAQLAALRRAGPLAALVSVARPAESA